MIKILGNFLVLFAVALTASAASEENVSRQVDAAPGGKLAVDVDCGSIDLAPGGADKVAIEAHRKIDFGDESREKEYLANVPITVIKEGNAITIRARGK